MLCFEKGGNARSAILQGEWVLIVSSFEFLKWRNMIHHEVMKI